MHPMRRRLAGAVALVSLAAFPALASEVGQGTFDTLLGDDFHCSDGGPGGSYVATFSFDDKSFNVNLPPGNNQLDIDFSTLGAFTSNGNIACVFDEGGTFAATGANEAGDFQWTEIKGEYIDHKPGIGEGDPFPFVGSARCATTRTDDFRTLCDNFEFSFNGLAKALAANQNGLFHHYAGDFNMRAVPLEHVPNGKPKVTSTVDGASGDVPAVSVDFAGGVVGPGDLRVSTQADAHGVVPAGVEFPVRGTTAIDHGSGAVPFFAGGDERFVEISTDAQLPAASFEVCLPLPATSSPAGVRPARVIHGEGTGVADRRFVDRTSRVDPTTGTACARVSGFSKFAVVTVDVCGGGQSRSDGLLTVAGGLIGKRTVVVDGLTDCTQFPANLPRGLARYCVPDADSIPGQCSVSLTLGVNRGGCNKVTNPNVDPHSSLVQVASYSGHVTDGSMTIDLNATFGAAIGALVAPYEATVGPYDVVLPVAGGKKITTYKLEQQLPGLRPGTFNRLDVDKDVLKIHCIEP
jgi:hypothetical protein